MTLRPSGRAAAELGLQFLIPTRGGYLMHVPLRRLLAALAATAPGLAAQALPQTTAERTNYAAASANADVGAFLDSLELVGVAVRGFERGTTALGKPVSCVTGGAPTVTSRGQA